MEELVQKELVFEGSMAYDIAHEMEHLMKKQIKGESLWEFKFKPSHLRSRIKSG